MIISFAEHNGSFSTAFKNVFDWASRVEKSMWLDKPMLLMATSPGARGGATVLAAASNGFPHQAGKVVGQFSLPSFYDNFSSDAGIKDAELANTFADQLNNFRSAL
ncbi:MAG: chromate reductase [Bacteroidia bacterium]